MNPGASEQELTGFLATHKVMSIERKLIDEGVNSLWAICVDFRNHATRDGFSRSILSRRRVDYKAILPPQEFAIYTQRRDLRKEWAGIREKSSNPSGVPRISHENAQKAQDSETHLLRCLGFLWLGESWTGNSGNPTGVPRTKLALCQAYLELI